ncbi:DsbA family protein [Massilia sp. TN1-12]|uniref:DsbA family protein n=1 Tax=Massilia paldalensis TaxID=3377675 RepID=UPI00384AFA4D
MQQAAQIGKDDHVRGSEDAALTLIEYGDFQCPYCARAHQALQELEDEVGGIRLVFRHLPLSDLHPLAELAAETAESAASQGRFWDMHDALFENQFELMDDGDLADLAEDLELDAERVRSELAARRHRPRVQADLARASEHGASRTPTFFINGVPYEGDSDRDSLREALTAALQKR